ncbi:hypothetical protein GCM10027271_14420 [Saccharopolyspora gloriosae]
MRSFRRSGTTNNNQVITDPSRNAATLHNHTCVNSHTTGDALLQGHVGHRELRQATPNTLRSVPRRSPSLEPGSESNPEERISAPSVQFPALTSTTAHAFVGAGDATRPGPRTDPTSIPLRGAGLR